MTLLSGTEAPLNLKRSLSQSCDPHRAYIALEIGSFEDTVGRVEHAELTSKGSRFLTFSYRVASKVPVDTAGVYHFPLEKNAAHGSTDSRNHAGPCGHLGWIIVRVSVRGGVKLVTVESPLLLKNTSDSDFLFEVREQNALSLVWRCLVPAQDADNEIVSPVPVDIVPEIHNLYTCSVIAVEKSVFCHPDDVGTTDVSDATEVPFPKAFSQSSFDQGFIGERQVGLKISCIKKRETTPDFLYSSFCYIRVGSFYLEAPIRNGFSKGSMRIPEQRMLVVRPPIMFHNHLPCSMYVEVRKKVSGGGQNGPSISPWIQLGVLHCGKGRSWSGAAEEIELRARLCGPDGGENGQFPSWSSTLEIPSQRAKVRRLNHESYSVSPLPKLRFVDKNGYFLPVTVVSIKGSQDVSHPSACDSTRDFSRTLAGATSVICFYAPFWIVDSTGLGLEYKTADVIAGQGEAFDSAHGNEVPFDAAVSPTLGLGELLEDSNLFYLPSKISFHVLMIGNKDCTKIFVRRKRPHNLLESMPSPWSGAIPLTKEGNFNDLFVSSSKTFLSRRKESNQADAFAIRSRLVRAPGSLGGRLGTRILHVVCRYYIVNETGREIEVSQSKSSIIPADTSPRPFHIDAKKPFRFRPTEYGWQWSGNIDTRKRRKEVTISLKHRMKRVTILITLEFRSDKNTGTSTIIFRPSSYAPYRITNRSMYPLHYRQVSSYFDLGNSFGRAETVPVMPFMESEFALMEPDTGRRSVDLLVSESSKSGSKPVSHLLVRYRIDSLAPGSDVRLDHDCLCAKIISDGPTRVLLVYENSIETESGKTMEHDQSTRAGRIPPSVSVRLSHGVGISVIDWEPRELLYIRFSDISLEQVVNDGKESLTASIGSIIADNQLWITPYPVVLRVGSRSQRRRKRHSAVALSWIRTHGSLSSLQLFDRIELTTEPFVVSVDGSLATHVLQMGKQFAEMFSGINSSSYVPSRNAILRKALHVDKGHGNRNQSSRKEQKDQFAFDLYSAVDYMATAATASKLKCHYIPPDKVAERFAKSDDGIHGAILQNKRKYYVEKLRVSTFKAEVSWSGHLPFSSLPRFMRPALTFEGLPVLFRPFSSSQNYGEADEYIEAMKAHYLSIWRAFDVVVGILTKPTFIVRACIFTSRESIAVAFENVAHILKKGESLCLSLVQKEDSDHSVATALFRGPLTPVITVSRTIFGALSQISFGTSSMLRYDASRHRAKAGLVRSRNPRLFAHVDGKDLLVEYMEGDSAGKALLSRVRQGVHLGEGYVFHIEGAHRAANRRRWETGERDPLSLILMVTFERILLLNGELNDRFCEVVWEVSLQDLVLVEQAMVFDDDDGFTVLLLWYLKDESSGGFKRDKRYVAYAKSLVAGAGGLGCMRSKPVFVPNFAVRNLLKLQQIQANLV